MTRQHADDALRERFQELRGEAARPGQVPDFEAMLARARSGEAELPPLVVVDGAAASAGRSRLSYGRLARAGAWASAALAATVAGLLLTDRRPSDEAEFEQLVAAYSADAWRSPTSGLLEVPGMELTRSIPSIGGPVRGLDPSTLPEREPAPPEENL